MIDEKTIVLSPRELLYLKSTSFLPTSLMRIIELATLSAGDRSSICLPREITEQFRDAFTERLARVGFDANYEPTSEGKMLEKLIDLFY